MIPDPEDLSPPELPERVKNDKCVVNFAFGRRGNALQTGTKTNEPVDFTTANRIFDKLVQEKMKKGYKGAIISVIEKSERESSFNPCVESEIDEKAVKKTIAEIKEFNCSATVAISYVRLSKKDNDLNVDIKVGDNWISVIRDEYEKDFIHIVTVADLSEVNKKFRM